MKKIHYCWAIPLAGAVLAGRNSSGESGQSAYYLDSTNRVTLSVRFGLNVHARFKGIGGGLLPNLGSGGGQVTPDGDQYNYSDGYVGNGSTLRADSTGNFLGYTSYWGYDHAGQYNPAANTFTFQNISSAGIPSGMADTENGCPGMELTYNWQLGEKENWHHLRYGIEAAINYMRFTMDGSSAFGIFSTTDVYQFGGIPNQQPAAGYTGNWAGNPGDPVLVVPGSSGPSSLTYNFLAQQDFDANIWGIRLGPYIEYPFSKKWNLHLSGGLAVGLVDAEVNWKESLTTVANNSTVTAAGGGRDVSLLWGYYVALDASYQISKRWGIEAGVQFQDLGTYSHNFSGRIAELDLSNSLFIQAGISYSF